MRDLRPGVFLERKPKYRRTPLTAGIALQCRRSRVSTRTNCLLQGRSHRSAPQRRFYVHKTRSDKRVRHGCTSPYVRMKFETHQAAARLLSRKPAGANSPQSGKTQRGCAEHGNNKKRTRQTFDAAGTRLRSAPLNLPLAPTASRPQVRRRTTVSRRNDTRCPRSQKGAKQSGRSGCFGARRRPPPPCRRYRRITARENQPPAH